MIFPRNKLNTIKLYTMTLDEILDCLRSWEEYRQKPDELSVLFDKKNTFYFRYQDTWGCNMHAYPGIDDEGKIWYFVIPKIYDKVEYRDDLLQYIEQCLLQEQPLGEEISPTEAEHRINNWLEEHPTWLPAQAETQNGIFQAFDIPKEDLNVEELTSYQALATADNPTGYRADLVIDDGIANTGAYYDTVRPVPPFKSSLDQASFYLLTLAGIGV